MNKNKKRLIASLSSVGILVLALSFGTLPKSNSDVKVEDNIDSIGKFSLSYLESGATKKVIKSGDSSEVIQKISVVGEIDEKMAAENVNYSVVGQINMAKENPNVKAILLSVDSPGGGVYESSEIYKALQNSGKDVYVSMKKQAASGGYYISMASKKIFANEETITGSLGVIMSSISAQKFLEDNGIKNQIIRSGEQKARGGLTEDLPDSTLEIYKELNKESYNKFVDVIAKGRNMDRAKVLELADGRIYSGTQAVANGLVDKIGSEKELIEEIKKELNLDNPEIVEYVMVDRSNFFLNQFVKSIAKDISAEIRNVSKGSKIERSYLG